MLSEIQQKLNVPKGQMNTFGNYKYRSCEDILEAVKPHLGKAILTLTDEMIELGGRVYVKATALLRMDPSADGNVIEHRVSAFAREAESKKGMDVSQVTGSASSYARKYALNGLFCIDDTKDADTQDNTRNNEPPQQETSDNPGAYRFKFGKYKNKCLMDIDLNELKSWAQWMIDNNKTDGAAKEALSAIKIYLMDIESVPG